MLAQHSPLALAFSGGLDSRFLAYAADLWASEGRRPHLFHIAGPHVPEEESSAARQWAKARGLPLLQLALDPLGLDEVRTNSPQRCYYCKKKLFSRLRDRVRDCPDFAAYTLCDGTNADDRNGHRPGLRALEELDIRSPLAEAGIDKALVRAAGRFLGLDNPEQSARPCLLTRFAYGVPASTDALRALAVAEAGIARQLGLWGREQGIAPGQDFRLRLTNRRAATDFSGSGTRTVPGSIQTTPPSDYTTELHLEHEVGPLWREKLSGAVQQAGFQEPDVRVLGAVHGYYDKMDS